LGKYINIMKKEPIKAVMLPAEKESYIGICIKEMSDVKIGELKSFASPVLMSLEYWKPQHLYTTVSQDVEPIKEGDWYYYENKIWNQKECIPKYHSLYGRKITATNDPKLINCKNVKIEGASCSLNNGCKYPSCTIAGIQQSFLKEFAANPNVEFEMEYEYVDGLYSEHGTTRPLLLKLNQDNTVNITSVDNVLANAEIVYRKVYGACGKDTNISGVLPSYISFWEQMNSITSVEKKMYSREDRKQIVRDFHQIVDDTWDEEDVENWIKENL
jgi:hypothetical protein